MGWRSLPNGMLVTAARGEPPPCPEGFLRNPNNKYICIPSIDVYHQLTANTLR
jgi:hypothetical protein